ncbi:MAG: macro domain-containing protein [Proteobacteria bacterium]|nr:macro domain-containing protein [Pseudomonadota bacterium]
MPAPFEIQVARIETLALDAVVNAANTRLMPGGGVDGALRAAAGDELTRLTDTLGPIEEGGATVTPGFKLPARYIIHTAAPVWHAPGEKGAKVATLARCYTASIVMASSRQFASLAFPCLGTGNFGWPRDFACAIAIAACEEALARAPSITRLVFCCFTEADATPYRAALR